MKKLLTVLLVVASMVIATTSAQALTFSLSEDGTGVNPLLTATFTDTATDVVTLVLDANLSGAAFVTEWFFNLASGIDFNSLSFVGEYDNYLGEPISDYVTPSSTALYGFSFLFSSYVVDNVNALTPLTYTITGTGLSADSFNVITAGGEYTRAYINSGNGDSETFSVAANGAPVSDVPEPATFLLLGGGLLALVGFSRKLKK